MLSFLNSIDLIRYLIVWRVNSSLAFFPRYLSLDLSKIIGTIISHRLPTKETGRWQKSLESLNESQKRSSKSRIRRDKILPNISWPIESVLFPYPGKRAYSRDELIFWELKLFGKHADHGLFLEVILPAMEEASYTSDPRWNKRNRLWGQFDIQSVYVARGPHWEPLVKDGQLDLRYKANSKQWNKNLTLHPQKRNYKNLNWITPFDFSGIDSNLHRLNLSTNIVALKYNDAPGLILILSALISRISDLIQRPRKNTENIYDVLNIEERVVLHEVFEKVASIAVKKGDIKPVLRNWPGNWIGSQQFPFIPEAVIPYLELASILHIGRQTHLGCGTFVLT